MIPPFYEDWIKSVTPDDDNVPSMGMRARPYGQPAETVGTLTNQAAFEKQVLGTEANASQENTVIKTPGSDEITLPKGFDHVEEAIQIIIGDQKATNPLAKHTTVSFTFRQIVFDANQNTRDVHVDPVRDESSVEKDTVYFLTNKEGTIVQSKPVRDPKTTLNTMAPEVMMECELMRQAQPFEVVKGDEDTYHVQAEKYTVGRTLVRVIIAHPDAQYFHDLPDQDKAELPEDFRQKHGIKFADANFVPQLG